MRAFAQLWLSYTLYPPFTCGFRENLTVHFRVIIHTKFHLPGSKIQQMLMVDNETTYTNPYRPSKSDDPALAPFAGRQKAFDHLYQHLTDPSGAGVSIILGRRDIGKTAMLRRFSTYFDENVVGVYLPLKGQAFHSESDWLNTLTLSTMNSLGEKDFSLYKLPKQNATSADMRRWMTAEYLPNAIEIIRNRRLIWLLDDAGSLIQWLKDGILPVDHFTYLHELVTQFHNLGIVLAMDSRYEQDIRYLRPLVTLTDVYRLTNLTEEETQLVMQQPMHNQYQISTETANAIYTATGGTPRLIQRFGAVLYERQQTTATVHSSLSLDDIKAVTPTIQQQSEPDLRHAWTDAGRNGQLVLTAITRLMYADPLAAVTTDRISEWLIESDFPLDLTAIHAAVRSLEYDDLIENAQSGIRLKSSLMQVWLLQNAQLTTVAKSGTGSRRIGLIAAVVVLALIIVVLMVVLGQQRPADSSSNATVPPTVTLVANP